MAITRAIVQQIMQRFRGLMIVRPAMLYSTENKDNKDAGSTVSKVSSALKEAESTGLTKVKEEPIMDISASTGMPEQVKTTRHVFIYQPSKSGMTSGRAHINSKSSWALEFDHASERWENPLMGWTSTRDTLNQLNLRFESAEDAVRFARKNGWSFEVREGTQESEWKSKAYADNFKYSAGKLRQIPTK